jgi:hypothetical protein
MAAHKIETFPIAIYCGSGRCHHSATLRGDDFPDDLPVRSLFGSAPDVDISAPMCGRTGHRVNKQHARAERSSQSVLPF